MRFDEFMELALYHREHGYYAAGTKKKLGRTGDFYTSVSVGDTFGMLLSCAIEKKWKMLRPGGTDPLVIVEQGAHDGQLARDILGALQTRNSPLFEKVSYRIITDSHGMSSESGLTGYDGRLYPVDSLEEAASDQGIFLCNELLDAFPVRRFSWKDGEWTEQFVRAGEDGDLELSTRPVGKDDADFVSLRNRIHAVWRELGTVPEGRFETEFSPLLESWMLRCAGVFNRSGCWWMIDYGFEDIDYFVPSRSRGTLQCYHRHQTRHNPLFRPGETDLTAHLNFSGLRQAGEAAGLRWKSLWDQSTFLTEAGRDWLESLDGKVPGPMDAKQLRQFQTLIHPGLMGKCFRIAEFES